MDEQDRTIVVFGGDDYRPAEDQGGSVSISPDDVPDTEVRSEAPSSDTEVTPEASYLDTEIRPAALSVDTQVKTEAAAADSGTEAEAVSVEPDLPQDVTAEVRPYDDTIVGADTNDYLEGYKQYIDKYEAGTTAEEEARKAREEAERLEAAYGGIETSYDVASAQSQQDSTAAASPSHSSPAAHRRAAASSASASGSRSRDPRYVTKGFLVACMVFTMLVSSVLGAFLGSAFRGNSGAASSGSKEVAEDNGQSQLSLSDATGSDLTISQIVDKNADAVVEILVSGTSQNYFGQMQLTEGAGSGVIVKADGYIVTNYHVIQGANKVQVTLHNGETYPASIVGGDSSKDIAVIKINASGLTTAEIGDSSTVSVGDTAVAIGNPLGQLGGTATTGIISALDRNLEIDGRTLTLMQTDAAINGGNSGGGLFNSKGQLIGIVDAKSSGVGIEGLAFAIPVNSVIDTINDLIDNGTVTSRPVVGITIQDVSEENAQYYQLEAAGVYIAQVTGENAQKAGFQQGDRILTLDGDEITDSQTFINKIRSHKAGDTVAIVVSRDGQEIEIRTELEEYTSAE